MHYNEKVYSIEEIKKIAGEIFDKACFVKEAYLFGSYAKGAATGDSDLDFMAITNKPLGTYFYWLYDPLQDTLGKEVDVPTEDEYERLRYKEMCRQKTSTKGLDIKKGFVKIYENE